MVLAPHVDGHHAVGELIGAGLIAVSDALGLVGCALLFRIDGGATSGGAEDEQRSIKVNLRISTPLVKWQRGQTASYEGPIRATYFHFRNLDCPCGNALPHLRIYLPYRHRRACLHLRRWRPR